MSILRNTIGLLTLAAPFTLAGLALSCGTASADSGVDWDKVAQCESGTDWDANTGNGSYGGLQFKQATWTAHGGKGSPAAASREEQIRIAESVVAKQGVDAWKSCGAAPAQTVHVVMTQPAAPVAVPGSPAAPASTGTTVSSAPAPSACQGIGRGPLGLVDFGKICQAFSSAFGSH